MRIGLAVSSRKPGLLEQSKEPQMIFQSRVLLEDRVERWQVEQAQLHRLALELPRPRFSSMVWFPYQ